MLQQLQAAQTNVTHAMIVALVVWSIVTLAFAAFAVVAAVFLLKCSRLVESATKALDKWTASLTTGRASPVQPRSLEAVSEAAKYGPK